METNKNETKLDLLYNDINYGVVLSFMEKFGKFLSLKEFIFDQIESSLIKTNEINPSLKEFLWSLIRNTSFGKSCKKEKFNTCLDKFMHKLFGENFEYGNEFIHLKLSYKLEIIKKLLESQFDENQKLKPILSEQASENDGLRSKPIGRDILGYYYWFYVDTSYNIRLFVQYSIDTEGISWKLIAKDIKQVSDLIEKLLREPMLDKLKTSERYKKKIENNYEISRKLNKRKKSISDSDSFDGMSLSGDGEISLKEIKKKIDNDQEKILDSDQDTNSTISNDLEQESRCTKCSKIKSEYMLIMCDSCDLAYHVDCLKPILEEIPDGDWYCPICEHDKLIHDLKDKIVNIEIDQKEYEKEKILKIKKEEEAMHKKLKIKEEMETKGLEKKYEDTIPSLEIRNGKRSCRSKTKIKYTFEEFDRQIKEATGSNNDESENDDKKSLESFKISGTSETEQSDSEKSVSFDLDINKSYLSYDESEYESNENEKNSTSPKKTKNKKKIKRTQTEIISQDESDFEQKDKLENRFKKFGLFRKRFKRVIRDSDDDYTAYNEDDYFNQNFDHQEI